MTTSRMCIPISTSIKSCSRKWPAKNFSLQNCSEKSSRPAQGGCCFYHELPASSRRKTSRGRLFNTAVQNSVQKQETTFATISARVASTFCTQPGAGTLVLAGCKLDSHHIPGG